MVIQYAKHEYVLITVSRLPLANRSNCIQPLKWGTFLGTLSKRLNNPQKKTLNCQKNLGFDLFLLSPNKLAHFQTSKNVGTYTQRLQEQNGTIYATSNPNE